MQGPQTWGPQKKGVPPKLWVCPSKANGSIWKEQDFMEKSLVSGKRAPSLQSVPPICVSHQPPQNGQGTLWKGTLPSATLTR